MNKTVDTVSPRKSRRASLPRTRLGRTLLAYTTVLSLGVQDVAWAVCSDGDKFPKKGFVLGAGAAKNANKWSPTTFTGTAGSLFIPDNSINEHNDPKKALTGGGHNWVFDQGSSLCKVTDVGPTGAPKSWSIPPVNPTECVVLPIIKNGVVTNIGDIPFQGDVITPTCDPSKLSTSGPNPQNTYFNQLGCSISHGAATTPATATSYLFVTGIKGGLFSVTLNNVTNPVVGGQAGKTAGPQNYYSAITEGQQLTGTAVSQEGQLVVATSNKRAAVGGVRLPLVWACYNPLGDPGDPGTPINTQFFVPPAAQVKCMSVGSHGLQTDLTTSFGPDNQPYFGGQRVVNSFDSQPGGNFNSAWPGCIWKNDPFFNNSLADAFNNLSSNGCGTAQPNFGFTSALITQPNAIIHHGQYMYAGPVGGSVAQFKVTVDPTSGLSSYQFRTYITGLSTVTGLGIAEDLGSLMIYTDPSALGLSGQEVVVKLPLCEDM